MAEAVRSIGVTQFTYYRWREEFGGLKSDQVKRLKDLEKENERLRKAVSNLTLEKLILREAAWGNYFSVRGSWVNSVVRAFSLGGLRIPGALASLRGQSFGLPHDGIRGRRCLQANGRRPLWASCGALWKCKGSGSWL